MPIYQGDMVKAVEEHPDYYVLENQEGEKVKAYKINLDEVNKLHEESVRKVAERLNKDDIFQILAVLTDILNDIPDVISYEVVATKLACNLQLLYDKVGSPNLFHHPIKNISLEVYGRAESFVREVVQLYETIIEIAEMMKEMGKLSEVQTAQIPYRKYTVQINTEDQASFHNEILELVEKYRRSGKTVKLRREKIHRTFSEIA